MTLVRNVMAGLRNVFQRKRADSELDGELRDYFDAAVEQKVKNGMSRNEALRAARLEMGSMEAVKEEVRSVGWETVLETFWQDVQFAFRMMGKNPAFTTTAILTLALGIGANTAIFSVVNTVLLQPMPYKQASRLVTIWGLDKNRGYDLELVSYPDYREWKTQNRVFESMGASTDEMFTLIGAGEPDAVIGYAFSPDFFDVLGVAPLLGRTFAPDEDQPGKNHVAVLNYRLWKTRFGGEASVLGRSIALDGQSYIIVGVMPRTFQYPENVELWTPLTITPDEAKDRSYRALRVMARLKPGVGMDEARAEMRTIVAQQESEYPTTNKGYDVNLISLRQNTSGDVRPALLILLCSVGFVLLIACANVANLLLSRAVARRREIAVRAALGASRSRMVRQFLTESILLAVIGGGFGLLLAYWSARGLVAMFPTTVQNLSIPRVEAIPIDRWVLSFALLASLLTGLIFGLVPALQASRLSAAECLKETGRTGTGGSHGRRFRNALVVAEVALSLVLLTSAGLLIKSFMRLVRANLGFQPDHVLTMRVLLPEYKYKGASQELAFSHELVRRIQSLPGVTAAGTVTFLPLSGWWGTREVSVVGRAPDRSIRNPRPVWGSISSHYFRAAKVPLIEGREFTEQDDASSTKVTILSAGLAHKLWPNDDPIGRQVNIDGFKDPKTVVGIVGDLYQLGIGVHQDGVETTPTSEVYVPFDQEPTHLLCFVIRTADDPLSIAKAAQLQVWAVDKEQAVSFVETMDQLASETVALQRASAILLGFFAALALMLASIGIYGVISYSACRRTHEIGIRMALGADNGSVVRLVIGEGLVLSLIGTAIGVSTALGLTRFLSSLLYGVHTLDPATFIAVPIVLITITLVACYIPARRAMRVDPMIALRYE